MEIGSDDFDRGGDAGVLAKGLFDPVDRVEDRRMVAIAVEHSDLGQGQRCEFPGQIDGYMAGGCRLAVTATGLEDIDTGLEMVR